MFVFYVSTKYGCKASEIHQHMRTKTTKANKNNSQKRNTRLLIKNIIAEQIICKRGIFKKHLVYKNIYWVTLQVTCRLFWTRIVDNEAGINITVGHWPSAEQNADIWPSILITQKTDTTLFIATIVNAESYKKMITL